MWLEIVVKIALIAAGSFAVLAVIFGIGAYLLYRTKNPRKTQAAPPETPTTAVVTASTGGTPKKTLDESFKAFSEKLTLKNVGWALAAAFVLGVLGSWMFPTPQDETASNIQNAAASPSLAELQTLSGDAYLDKCRKDDPRNYKASGIAPGKEFFVDVGTFKNFSLTWRGPDDLVKYQINGRPIDEPITKKIDVSHGISSLTFKNVGDKTSVWVGVCGYDNPT